MAVAHPLDAPSVLNREFLEIRAKILELGASFDRLGRASGSVEADPRMERIREALGVLLEAGAERAEQIQLIFSRDYETDWREKFGVATTK